LLIAIDGKELFLTIFRLFESIVIFPCCERCVIWQRIICEYGGGSFGPWENFSLTEEEDVELSIQREEFLDGVTYGQSCVLGKLLAERLVSKETIRAEFVKWWKPEETFSFKILGDNLFLVEFEKFTDKKRVLEGRPWVFEGSLFLVEDFDGSKTPSQFVFDKAAFWVQMTNLPLACMGREIGRKIGASVGVVEAVDTDARGMGWGESLRVKILIDLSKPLPRGRKINVEGQATWITFKYERLPRFCFHCGVIWHGKGGCPKRSSFRQQEMNQYGMWLRAPSPTRRTERISNRYSMKKEPATTTKYPSEDQGYRGRKGGEHPGGGRNGGRGETDETRGADFSKFEKGGRLGGNHGENMELNGNSNYGKGQYMQEGFLKKDLGNKNSNVPDMRPAEKERKRGNRQNINYEDLATLHGAPDTGTPRYVKKQTIVSMGHGASASSPKGYMGPSIVEVEQTMKGNKATTGELTFDHRDNPEKGCKSLKRKASGVQELAPVQLQEEGARKKRNSTEELVRSNQIAGGEFSDLVTLTHGSGMSEAVVQPRQPQ
jgi:hypothetical protein